ncbi:unnamed protein product, partial [Iphiclides podalirius]
MVAFCDSTHGRHGYSGRITRHFHIAERLRAQTARGLSDGRSAERRKQDVTSRDVIVGCWSILIQPAAMAGDSVVRRKAAGVTVARMGRSVRRRARLALDDASAHSTLFISPPRYLAGPPARFGVNETHPHPTPLQCLRSTRRRVPEQRWVATAEFLGTSHNRECSESVT